MEGHAGICWLEKVGENVEQVTQMKAFEVSGE